MSDPQLSQLVDEWQKCPTCGGDGCANCKGEGGYSVVRLRQPDKRPMLRGLVCDVCGYQSPTKDYGTVIECADGVIRCKVCRGVGKWPRKRQAKVQP